MRHHTLLEKVAKRVEDDDVMRLLKLILKVSGKKGVPQGGVITRPTMLRIFAPFGAFNKRARIHPVYHADLVLVHLDTLDD